MTIESHRTTQYNRLSSKNAQRFHDIARDLPRTPGVYIMRDSLGIPVYVGKAKDLRRRVGSYFTPSALRDNKVSKMLATLAGLYYAETDSELEALLLESRLVKQWLPMFNRDLRQPESICFLRLDANEPLPAIRVVRSNENDGALYAGPFRGMSFVSEAMEAVRCVYKLRWCTDPLEPGSRKRACAYRDFGKCSGPCAGHENADDYRARVRAAWESLSGASDDAVDRLVARRTELVEQFRFEQAYRVQTQIRAIEAVGRGRLTAPSALGGRFVIVVPSGSPARPVVLLISHGKLVARFVCGEHCTPTAEQIERMLRCLDHPNRDLLPGKPSSDDLLIVHSYLRRHRLRDCILPYPSAGLVQAVRAAVERMRTAGDEPHRSDAEDES